MVNAEIEQQFGYRREELIGESVDMLVLKHLRGPHASAWSLYNANWRFVALALALTFGATQGWQ